MAQDHSSAQTITQEMETPATSFTLVQVAVQRPLYTTFSYKIAGEHGDEILGCRVALTFAHSKSIGIVVQIGSGEGKFKVKEATLIDTKPLIPYDVLETMRMGAAYYKHPLGPTLMLALPKLLREGAPACYKSLPALAPTLQSDELDDALASLHTPIQKELLLEIQKGPRSRRELRDQGFSAAHENQLIKRGFATRVDLAQDVPPFDLQQALSEQALLQAPHLTLNEEQQNALDAINAVDEFQVFLLNGVTGSGKTEVYLQAIEHTLSRGESALVLVPEISLTPQTLKRFYRRFKVPIATAHSSLSDRERLDAFLDMYYRRAVILIGTRSALFTPMPNLGLIIIDEEHDSSFKQDDNLRYHARTMAIYRAQLNNCKLILGSATPSLETLYNVEKGLITELVLHHRARATHMPTMILNDLRQENYADPWSPIHAGISSALDDAIGTCTALHQQALLFLNRRGSARHLQCHECGKIISCPYCSNNMTVHRGMHMLHCHICDTKMPLPEKCPYCGSPHLVEDGLGTERIENYLRARFPDIGIERIDRDNITNRSKLDAALNRVLSHQSEIMIGTQMLAKGHDFPDVTLVGILDVDAGLTSDNYRALEETAQLITQVAGRAGRATTPGQVLIQSRCCNHDILQMLLNPDVSYRDIATRLLKERKALQQPPYTQQALIMTSSPKRDKAFDYLSALMEKTETMLQCTPEITCTPVVPDRIEKRANRYYFNCVLTSQTPQALNLVLDAIVQFSIESPISGDVRFAIDVDPMDLP